MGDLLHVSFVSFVLGTSTKSIHSNYLSSGAQSEAKEAHGMSSKTTVITHPSLYIPP